MQKEIENIIVGELSAMVREIQTNIKLTGQEASGATARSLVIEPRSLSILVKGRNISNLEKGFDGKDIEPNFKDIILEWIKAKRIFEDKTESQKRSIAYLTARKIAGEGKDKKRGTLLYKAGGREDVYTPAIKKMRESIRKKIAAQILSTLVK